MPLYAQDCPGTLSDFNRPQSENYRKYKGILRMKVHPSENDPV